MSVKIPRALKTIKAWGRWKNIDNVKTPLTKSGLVGVDFNYLPQQLNSGDKGIMLGNNLGGVDLDNCIVNNSLMPWAEAVVQLFDSYTEISPSGKGLKIYCKGTVPLSRHKLVMQKGNRQIEAYVKGRWFAFTGNTYKNYSEVNTNNFAWRLISVILERPTLRDLWKGYKEKGDRTKSGLDFSFADELLKLGFTPLEVKKALEVYWPGQIYSLPKDKSERQIDRILEKVIENNSHHKMVEDRINWLRADQEARLALRKENSLNTQVAQPYSVSELLSYKFDEPKYSIDQIVPYGSNILLTAKYKSGKTTFLINMIKAIITGDDFLGKFKCERGSVLFLNYEIRSAMMQRWLQELGIVDNRNLLKIVNFRDTIKGGPPLRFDHEEELLHLIELCRNKEWVIIDPYRNARLGKENETDAAALWTFNVDRLKREANVTNIVVSTHTGRADDTTARGASALNDWADAQLLIQRKDGARWFSADGRDVEVPEYRLVLDNNMLFIERPGAISNRELEQELIEAIAKQPGINMRNLRQQLEVKQIRLQTAINYLMRRKVIVARRGTRNSTIFYLATVKIKE